MLNELNFVELELTLLAETTSESDTRDAFTRLREIIRHSAGLVRSFSPQLITEERSIIPAAELVEQWKVDAKAMARGTPVAWNVAVGEVIHSIETRVIRSLLVELLKTVIAASPQHPIHVDCWIEAGRACYEVSAPADAVSDTPRTAFQNQHWAALEHLAARNDGVLTLLTSGSEPLRVARLELPLCSLAASLG